MPGPEEGYVEILQKAYHDTPNRLSRSTADEVLRKGFGADTAASAISTAWEDAATDWQLEAERSITSDPKMAELARKAYISNVRAYATHVVAERGYFDVKALHLGHLAKAFGLRERPGQFGRGGESNKGGKRGAGSSSRRGKAADAAGDGTGKKQKRSLGKDDSDDDVDRRQVDKEDAAKRMRKAMKTHMGAASEFNIG